MAGEAGTIQIEEMQAREPEMKRHRWGGREQWKRKEGKYREGQTKTWGEPGWEADTKLACSTTFL